MENDNVPKMRFPEFNECWDLYKLGDLYTERNERGNDTLQILSVSIHSGVSDAELNTENLGKTVRRSEDKTTYKHVYPGDLVFNMMRAWQGAIGVAKNEGMISPAYISAIPCGDVFPLFMDYALRRREAIEQINDLSYGVTDFRKRLYWNSFVNVSVALPQKAEQEKIWSFLKRLDRLIDVYQKKNELLKTYKQTMLQGLFPKEGETVPEIRFPDFYETWKPLKLAEILEEFSNRSRIENEYPVLSSTNVGMEFRDGRVSGVSNVGYKIIEIDDLVLSPQNLWLGNININDIGKGIVSPSYKTFKLRGVETDFFRPQVRTKYMLREYYNASVQGASVVRRNLDLDKFNNIRICVPSVKEQIFIGRFFRNLDHLITLHQHKLDEMKAFKNGLLQQMFV